MNTIKPGNSFAERYPELVAEWDSSKNELTPDKVSFGNTAKVWWICSTCNYGWEAKVINRHQGRGCPACAGTVVVPGRNDLLTANPAYANWWAETKTTPVEYSPGSNQKLHWKCPQNGHVFIQPVRVFKFSCTKCIDRPLSIIAPHLVPEWSTSNQISPNEVSYNSAQKVAWVCQKCDHTWKTPVYQRVNSTSGCPKCSKSSVTSKAEEELAAWFSELGFEEGSDFIRNDRLLLSGREVDFYFPLLNIAIEYNGLRWHSEAKGRGETYHYEKWSKAKDAKVQLIQIWADDWAARGTVVRSMLTHKLQASTSPRVYARKTALTYLTYKQASLFLDANHIQGSARGTLYLGLKDADNLVAVSVWKLLIDGTLLLERYATSKTVVGGMGKLLKAAPKHLHSQGRRVTQIVTFAAHDVSDGNLYEKLGFAVDKELPADYMYVVKGERRHKFGYRKSRFQDDPALVYVDGLTEKELAVLNKIDRVWDSGKTRYVLHLTQQGQEPSP